MPDLSSAIDYAIRRLSNELSPLLSYHSLNHTRDEVVPAVMQLAAYENINNPDLTLLITAAFFHDIGFVIQRKDHEERSAEISTAILPNFGYTKNDIFLINGIILATRLPQSPKNLLEEIMADGDLDNIGRDTFFRRSLDLRNELANFGVIRTDLDWYTNQLVFLNSHQFFTKSAQKTLNPKKLQNMKILSKLIKQAAKEEN